MKSRPMASPDGHDASSDALLRRRFGTWLIVVVVLGIQLGWTAYGWMNPTSFGWGNRVSFRNLSASPPMGCYAGNERGMWTVGQIGWRMNDPAAAAAAVQTWSEWGLLYVDARAVHARLAAMNVLWTIVPNALLAIVTGVLWYRAWRRVRTDGLSYRRGFPVGQKP